MAADAYTADEPTRAEVDATAEPMVLDFGTNWCGWCRSAQPHIQEALAGSGIRHVKVEDGPGRRLGRSFQVKLWPTLVFVQGGQEVARVTRPADAQAVRDALAQMSSRA
jgi:thioredoxin 1